MLLGTSTIIRIIAFVPILVPSTGGITKTDQIQHCSAFSEKKINKCLQPMLDYANELQEETGSLQFPVQASGVFTKLCDIYSHFKDCTATVSCSSLATDAMDASYSYMCGTGHKLFQDQAACFAQVEAEDEYIKCKKSASKTMMLAQKSKKPDEYTQYFKKLCSVMDEYLRCSHPVINEHCGSNAWELVKTVTLDSLRVTMPKCDLHNALL